jgi:hypothetical protein
LKPRPVRRLRPYTRTDKGSSRSSGSEPNGESEGVLSQSRSSEVVVGSRIPCQWSPSKGSSARISFHVRDGVDGLGFLILSRKFSALVTVDVDGGCERLSWAVVWVLNHGRKLCDYIPATAGGRVYGSSVVVGINRQYLQYTNTSRT